MTGIHSGHKAKVSKPRKGGRTPLEKDTTDQTERQPLLVQPGDKFCPRSFRFARSY